MVSVLSAPCFTWMHRGLPSVRAHAMDFFTLFLQFRGFRLPLPRFRVPGGSSFPVWPRAYMLA